MGRLWLQTLGHSGRYAHGTILWETHIHLGKLRIQSGFKSVTHSLCFSINLFLGVPMVTRALMDRVMLIKLWTWFWLNPQTHITMFALWGGWIRIPSVAINYLLCLLTAEVDSAIKKLRHTFLLKFPRGASHYCHHLVLAVLVIFDIILKIQRFSSALQMCVFHVHSSSLK